MTEAEVAVKSDILWRGRPWIAPAVTVRCMVTLVALVVISWLEFLVDVAFLSFFGLYLFVWTGLVIILVLFVILLRLLLMRASRMYVLRRNSLEVETGILGKKAVVLTAMGFSDLELTRSISGRILNVGEIVVRTDSGVEVRLKAIRNPVQVSNLIRDVMTKPSVKLNHDF